MNKDIIYIDTEDDITSIIGKIKSSKDKIIALVPPKRIGVLQSAVNLRLLARTAQLHKKHIVLITNNKALISLSAMAKIPVAKNLQSKPEIAEIAALKVDDDVIDGAKLPVGDLVRTVKVNAAKNQEIVKTHDFSDEDDSDDLESENRLDKKSNLHKKPSVDDVIDDINIDDEDDDEDDVLVQPSVTTEKPTDSMKPQRVVEKKSSTKIPNFSKFRRRLFFGTITLVALVAFGVWAIMYAPAAKITITAKTSKAPVSVAVKLVGTEATDISKRTAQAVVKTLKKDLSVDFTATGSEDRGEKATGTATLCNATKGWEIEVVAGSIFTNGAYKFTTAKSVDVPAATVNDGIVAGCIEVGLIASEIGAEYNLPAGSYASSVANVTAKVTATSGGSSHKAVVVTAEDIEKATQTLKELSTSSMKSQLIAQFTNGESVISDSFSVDYGSLVSAPALDAEVVAGGKAKLTAPAVFTMTGISKSDVLAYLKESLDKQVSKGQRVYDDGLGSVKLNGYSKNDTSAVVSIEATGKIGPDIDKEKVKLQVRGEQYGDVQSTLSSIEGVSSVDTTFSYFWVRTVPNDEKKITVEFKIENE